VRHRSIVNALSRILFDGKSLRLQDWPATSAKVIGMSDSDIIAMPLAAKIGYQNTYLHQAPQLDLLRPPQALRGTVDVVVCAEVLEHIPPSIDVAINNLFALLVPGGSAIITVPYRLNEQTLEHYPRLHEYRLE
jgi:SAM-dependent methyltransferase